MGKISEKDLVNAIKEAGGTSVYPVNSKEIYKKLVELKPEVTISKRQVSRDLLDLLGDCRFNGNDNDNKVDRGDYYLGYEKKNKYVTGYWYEKKVEEIKPNEFTRFLTDAVIYSKVINPEFKTPYYANLQDIFGKGAVPNITDFIKDIIDLRPYSDDSDDDAINILKNVLLIQEAIDSEKKIRFKLRVYRYNGVGIELNYVDNSDKCVSPFQIMMSNGRYYLIAKIAKSNTDFLFFRIDLMDEIEILKNEKSDMFVLKEWKEPGKFIVANPYFYSGIREDIVIGFEEQNITQIIDWFGPEYNGLYEIVDEPYWYQKPKLKNDKVIYEKVEMVKLKFKEVNAMAFSFWVMQYMDCVEIIEGEELKSILKDRMTLALEYRIRGKK